MRSVVGPLGIVALVASSLVAIGVSSANDATPAGAAVVVGQPQPLGTFPWPERSRYYGGGEAFGINDAGTIVGRTKDEGTSNMPFRFDPVNHTVERLQLYGYESEWALPKAVNGRGSIVGQLSVSDGWIATRPAIWSPAGLITIIGDLGGDFGVAYDISDGGVAVGEASMARPEDPNVWPDSHAFVSKPNGGLIDIGTLPGGASSTARGIDEDGLVVGTSEIGSAAPCLTDPSALCGATHAFTYDRRTGTRTDIGTLPGGTSSEATGINDEGIVVGSSLVPGPGGTAQTHPFTYDTATATFTDLGTIPGAPVLRATAINDDGVVVGNIGASGAWAYDPSDATVRALPRIERLNDINNTGMAVGSGLVPTGVDDVGQPLPGEVVGSIRVQLQVNPSAPNLVQASSCPGPVDLVWSRPTDAGYATNVTYRVYRNGTPIATTNAVSLRDLGGAAGASYAVQAVNDAGASAVGDALAAACAPSITGIVASDGLPVAGIDVRVHPFGAGPVVAKTTTAVDGTYAVSGLAPGRYRVRFSSPTNAYPIQWNGGAFTPSTAPAVVVGAGATAVDADLSRAGIITGTVTNGTALLAGIDVRIYVSGTIVVAAKARTGPDGRYVADGLPSGSYEVRFSSSTGAFGLQWNGGVATRAAAAPVVVTASAPVGVDAAMVAAARITGRFAVYDRLAHPVHPGGLDIRIHPVGAPAIAKTTTTATGDFAVGALAPGAYLVRVSDAYGRVGIVWIGRGPVGGGLVLTSSMAEAEPIALPAGSTTDVGAFAIWGVAIGGAAP